MNRLKVFLKKHVPCNIVLGERSTYTPCKFQNGEIAFSFFSFFVVGNLNCGWSAAVEFYCYLPGLFRVNKQTNNNNTTPLKTLRNFY